MFDNPSEIVLDDSYPEIQLFNKEKSKRKYQIRKSVE